MRIKQNLLKEPDLEFTRGEATVRVYSKPQYCVNIIRGNEKQCYPLTEQQYNEYMNPAANINIAGSIRMCKKYSKLATKTKDARLKKFYMNAAEGFSKRGARCY